MFYRYDVQVSVSDVTSTNVEVNVTVDVQHVSRKDVTMATPLDIGLPSADLVKIDQVIKDLIRLNSTKSSKFPISLDIISYSHR